LSKGATPAIATDAKPWRGSRKTWIAARHPERVKRMLVASPAPGGVEASARPMLEARMAKVEREGMEAVVDASMDKIYPPAYRFDAQRFERLRARWLTISPTSFVALNRMLVSMDLTVEFANVACPTLVIGCTHDGIRPAAMSEEIARAIPGAAYAEADSGHFMAIETPELFAALVVSFAATK
jgi:3-oxoadipate enol-lactonase